MSHANAWTEREDTILAASKSYSDYVDRSTAAGIEPREKLAAINHRAALKRKGVRIPEWPRGTPSHVYAENGERVQPESRLESQPESDDDSATGWMLPPRPDGPIDRYYELVKQISNVAHEMKAETRVIEWTAPVDGWVGLAFPGDLHIGGPIDYDQLESDLDLIERTDGLWCIGLGDYSNNFQAAAKLLKAMSEDVVPGSEDQMALVHHVMCRTSKWLGILEGNHDGWSGSAGLKALATRLGCPFVSEAGCSLKVQTGNQRYVGYLKHSWKGHSNLNTSNESRRMWNEFPEWENADFTVLAHYHQPDTHQKEIKTQTVAHLRGGTYKHDLDPYARKHGYVPEYGIPLVLLSPYEKELIPFHARNWRRGLDLLEWLRGTDANLSSAREVVSAIGAVSLS